MECKIMQMNEEDLVMIVATQVFLDLKTKALT